MTRVKLKIINISANNAITGESFTLTSKCFVSSVIQTGYTYSFNTRCFPYLCTDAKTIQIQIASSNYRVCTQNN